MFARLLVSAIEKDELASDKFEEFARILQEISVRELAILNLLKTFELNIPHQRRIEKDIAGKISSDYIESDMQKTANFWETFLDKASNKFSVKSDVISALLTGLNRTGLYETFTGAFLDYSGGRGKTTILFKEFTYWIKFEADTDSILYPDE